MTISDKIKKAGNAVLTIAKHKAENAIANEKARKEAQKFAWKDMSTGSRARNIDSYGEFAPAIIWVADDGVYATDKYKAGIVEITGDDANKFRAESIGAAAIAKQSRSGFGSVSPMDIEIPSYLTGAPDKGEKSKSRREPQTYEEWMGFK